MYCVSGIGPAIAMSRRISVSSGVISLIDGSPQWFAPQRNRNEREAGEQQWQGQQHAHGEAAPEIAELRVGLAHQFAQRTRNRIAGREHPDDRAPGA